MSGIEVLYVVGHLLGKVLEVAVRTLLVLVLAAVVVVFFLGAAVFGATKLGRKVEYRTRPD